jgi:signal transduction histidine kinase
LGLGLSISHAIVENHGGQLAAVSPVESGGGSLFILRLPSPDQQPLQHCN